MSYYYSDTNMKELSTSNSHIKSWLSRNGGRSQFQKMKLNAFKVRHETDGRDHHVAVTMQKVRYYRPDGFQKVFWEEKSRLKLDSGDQYGPLSTFIARSFGAGVSIEQGKKVVAPQSRTMKERISSIFKSGDLKKPNQKVIND